MHRSAFILLAAGFPLVAQAQALHQSVSGSKLEIGLPCAKDISVVVDPALSGQVVLDATAAHQEELNQIEFTGGASAKLKRQGGLAQHGDCWRPDHAYTFEPTLQVRLSVPHGLPIGVDASGDGSYHLAVGGPLDLAMSGSGRLDATEVTALNVDITGSGKSNFGHVSGAIHATLSGSGEVVVAQAEAPAVAIDLSGSGGVKIQAGRVGQLAIASSGSGAVAIGATVEKAAVDGSGSGDVVIARLTGQLAQSMSGSGGVTVQSK